jgi:hypothetical protein
MAQPALKGIKIFFRTNKNTCIDWFLRARYFILFVNNLQYRGTHWQTGHKNGVKKVLIKLI